MAIMTTIQNRLRRRSRRSDVVRSRPGIMRGRWMTSEADGPIAEHHDRFGHGLVARLYRKDGRVMCSCPYACMAACEPCAFAGRYDKDGQLLP